MREKIIAGNWKMNPDYAQGLELIANLKEAAASLPSSGAVKTLVFPPYVFLPAFAEILADSSVNFGAQNVASTKNGAFTGEVSATMLKSLGARYCIIGHSERREYFGENEEILLKKINLLLEQDIIPVYCCGERLEERQAGKHFDVVSAQVRDAIGKTEREQARRIVIAYEPVWAIGTGVVASPEQAQEMHAFIRGVLTSCFDQNLADEIPVLYGGSVKASNSAELFACPDIDGALVGGASLIIDDFCGIIKNRL